MGRDVDPVAVVRRHANAALLESLLRARLKARRNGRLALALLALWLLTLAIVWVAPAHAARSLVIPPATAPGGGAGYLELELSITDANGNPVPAGLPDNSAVLAGIGVHVV